ncbi:MAG TPA: DUF1573 domain-containing protein [Planctomycetota bacterium]|nr:DUF1573 domain-containing protein [Planctomycetota bacterium]
MKSFYFLLIFTIILSACSNLEERHLEWTQKSAKTAIRIEPGIKNLGTIPDTKVVNFDFEIINDSEKILEIFHVRTFCGCTVAKLTDKQVLPGKSTKLTVAFDPRGKSGLNKWEVQIENNITGTPILGLFEANVVRDHYISHPSFSFGEFRKGTPIVRKIWISPREYPEYKIDKWNLELNQSQECFHVDFNEEQYEGFYPEARPATCISLKADPNIPYGKIEGKLILTILVPKPKVLEIPVYATVTKTLATNKEIINMNDVTVHMPIERSIIIYSVEEESLFNINDINISLPFIKVAKVESISKRRYYEIYLEALADASTPIGNFEAELTIHTNLHDQPTVTIPIQGRVINR